MKHGGAKTVLDIMGHGFDCSECGANYDFFFNYCPDCGHEHGGKKYVPDRRKNKKGKKCGETFNMYIPGVGNLHVCVRPRGHKGTHQCANCQLGWI